MIITLGCTRRREIELSLLRVGDGNGEGIGGVVRARNMSEFEKHSDHFLHLGFLGLSKASNGLLDLQRSVFAGQQAGLR